MDTNEIITMKISELGDQNKRMDDDKSLLVDPFVLEDFKGKKIDNAISVTLNDAGTFANSLVTDLMNAQRQIKVEGEGLSNEKKHLIESFIEDYRAQVDEALEAGGEQSLYSSQCWYVCHRSIIGARWLTTYGKDGDLEIDCLVYDMRWTPYEFGRRQLDWVANICYRTAAQIAEDYPNASIKSGTEIELREYFDDDKHEVWIDGSLAKKQKNIYGRVPAVIVQPNTGYLFKDKGGLKYRYDSIFFLIRDLVKEKNRQASIEQTLGMDIIAPPYEQETEDAAKIGEGGDPVPTTGQVMKVLKGERHVPVPRGDLNNASRASKFNIDEAIKMGSAPSTVPGQRLQSVSAVSISAQEAIKDKFRTPRLQALASFDRQSARMVIDQMRTITKGEQRSLSAGATGKRKQYGPADFGDPKSYTIDYELTFSSTEMDIARLAMFEASRNDLPLEVRLKDILRAKDPAGIMREKAIEDLRRALPEADLYYKAIEAAKEAKAVDNDSRSEELKIYSKMCTDACVQLIKQRKTSQQPLPEEEQVPKVEEKGGTGNMLMGLMPSRLADVRGGNG